MQTKTLMYHSEYENYLVKHLTEPFVMLDEMNLCYNDFEQLYINSYYFRQMWSLTALEVVGCNYSYYEIRAGKCEYAKVYHGKVHCSNKNCT